MAARIRDIIGHQSLFFIVVDEAQSAAIKFPSAFRSRSNNRQAKRPVSSQILRTLNDVHNSLLREYTMIIVSGTGIRYDTIKPIVESNVSKPTGVDTVTATGSFGPQDQREYIIKYLFPKKTKLSASDKTFLRRAWRWLCGKCHYPTLRVRVMFLTSISFRFRFTARVTVADHVSGQRKVQVSLSSHSPCSMPIQVCTLMNKCPGSLAV